MSMDKEHLLELFDAYRRGWNTFEYSDDEELNQREVYDEMMKFITEYSKTFLS